ncbi:MAG: DUF4390 domain-containing protein [Methylococcaceae bacterium]|nr:DUF4390 domain-containing protein [Methylococcaceae bacterium]
MKAGSRWLMAFCLLLVCLTSAGAAEYGFRILRAELKPDPTPQAYRLDADIDYRFSEPAIDALQNGVSLTLVLHVKAKRDSDSWRDEVIMDEKHSFRVRYHALSKQYQIVYPDDGTPRNFVSLNALLEAMGSIRDLPLRPIKPFLAKQRYRASLDVTLDIESLPLPLRPVAYLTPAWYLDSPLYKWTFAE